MFDPAALGITIIGLDRIRREQEHYDRGDARIVRSTPPRHLVRHAIATVLRRVAALIEPRSPGAYGATPADG